MDVFGLTWQFNALAREGPVELSAKERDRLRANGRERTTENDEIRRHPEGVILSRGRGAGARCAPAVRC